MPEQPMIDFILDLCRLDRERPVKKRKKTAVLL